MEYINFTAWHEFSCEFYLTPLYFRFSICEVMTKRLSTTYFLRLWEDTHNNVSKSILQYREEKYTESQAIVNVILITPPNSLDVDSAMEHDNLLKNFHAAP